MTFEQEIELLLACRTTIGVAAMRRRQGAKEQISDNQIANWWVLANRLEGSGLAASAEVVGNAEETLREMIIWAEEAEQTPDPAGAATWKAVADELTQWVKQQYQEVH
jgi:hypothetical protein